MHDKRLLLTALALAGAMLVAGCAHESGSILARPEPGQPGPDAAVPALAEQPLQEGTVAPAEFTAPAAAPDAAEAKVVVKKPPRVKPEHDARYHLPLAGKRALNIYLGSQTFEYLEDEQVFLSGPISSGTREHPTPAGDYKVLTKIKDKRSGKYTNGLDENTPMPYSLQFNGPYFVHEGWVPGYADSHGCVRLLYEDARLLYDRIRIGDPVRVKVAGTARPEDPYSDQIPVF
jgi:lipoprotein-anchoring transpeptidase ErfK/SrfK